MMRGAAQVKQSFDLFHFPGVQFPPWRRRRRFVGEETAVHLMHKSGVVEFGVRGGGGYCKLMASRRAVGVRGCMHRALGGGDELG